MTSLVLTPLEGIPLVQQGGDLAAMLLAALDRQQIELRNSDVLVLAQKIVSKVEGRLRKLADVKVSAKAKELAETTQKDPRMVQLILDESKEVLRARPNLLIVEHRLGFICANAGIDHSNVEGKDDEYVLLLPEDPDASAQRIRTALEQASDARLGVLIIDSHGRAWREGVEGAAIGLSGIPGVVDLRGRYDLVGRELKATTVGAADELAAAASLAMGQASEGTPAVHVRGFPYPMRDGNLGELLRAKEKDEFR